MMRSLSLLPLGLVLAVGFLGCGGTRQLEGESQCAAPEWYTDVPQEHGYLFSAKSATSPEMQVSLDEATAEAWADLSQQVGIRVREVQKRFDEEMGIANDAGILERFAKAARAAVSASAANGQVKSRKMCKEGSVWRSYVLVEYPVGATGKALIQQLQSDEQIYTRLQSSRVFKDLDSEVQKYDQWTRQQPH